MGFIFIASLLLSLDCNTFADTITAPSASRDAVGAAYNAASDGDTIVIPAGSAEWTVPLFVAKAIHLQGAGTNLTILRDSTPRPNNTSLIVLSTSVGKPCRVSGIWITNGSATVQSFNGSIYVGGSGDSWRIDNCLFTTTYRVGVQVQGSAIGVIDHCGFYAAGPGPRGQGIKIRHDTWQGYPWGDGSWAANADFGSSNFVFVENCTFSGMQTTGACDADGGARYVMRNNTFIDANTGNHGTESTGRYRSARAWEYYNNTFHTTLALFAAISVRGGSGVIWGNSFNGYGASAKLANYRSDQAYPIWGLSNGFSAWDQNAEPTGWLALDQCGAGTGDLIDPNNPPLVARWPVQARDPIYFWGNTAVNTQWPEIYSDHAVIQLGRDFFRATRPGYVPYAYPHPLVSSVPVPVPDPVPDPEPDPVPDPSPPSKPSKPRAVRVKTIK